MIWIMESSWCATSSILRGTRCCAPSSSSSSSSSFSKTSNNNQSLSKTTNTLLLLQQQPAATTAIVGRNTTAYSQQQRKQRSITKLLSIPLLSLLLLSVCFFPITAVAALALPPNHRYRFALGRREQQPRQILVSPSIVTVLPLLFCTGDDEPPFSSANNKHDDEEDWELMFQSWKKRRRRQEEEEETGNKSNNKKFDDDEAEEQLLVEWAAAQRRQYQKDVLSSDRLDKLKAIGLVDDDDIRRKRNTDNWESMFEELVSFQQDHGHCNAEEDHFFIQNPALAVWVIGQREWKCRRNFIKGGERFLAERIKRLDGIGFDWQPENYFFGQKTISPGIQQQNWDRKFLELVRFKEDHGHFDVPFIYIENPSLGFFVKSQRSWPTGTWGEYPKEWKDGLDRVGFTWEHDREVDL